jgi:ParB-like chromosome segregation protein Spo0J
MKVREIPLDRIFIKKNIRFDTDEELGELIGSTEHMLLQPIGVFPRGDRYEIVFGHRRFRAAQMNNEATIAAHILEISESDIPLIKLQENMVRKQLTNEEILAAVDELKRRQPDLNDHQIERMLGKNNGYLGFRRSLAKAYDDLEEHHGLKRDQLNAMSSDEILELRARLANPQKPARGNAGSYHRKEVPKTGFRIVNTPGPNVVVVCACKKEKLRVMRNLRELAKKIGA